jgi:hypothetical protein
MRTWPIALLLLSATASVAGACGSTPSITVFRGAELKTVEPVQGDTVKVKRRTSEPFAGAVPGYHVLRTEEDWQRVFPPGHEAAASARPADPNRTMMVVVAPETKDIDHVKVSRVVETGSFVHVFVKETKRGPGCAARSGEDAVLDVVATDRIDKPVRFYVEDEDGTSCGDPPAVSVKCRTDGGQTWADKVSARPGDVVECEVSAESRGTFAIADRAMTIGELPGGSTAKLVYGKGATRGTFPVDVFGAYAIKGEATDESGRKSTAFARIEAAPPRTKDLLVQLVWTNFDASDDPDTFPRVRLRATDEGSKRECTVDTPADGCQVKTRSAYTHMTLKGSAAKTKLVVSYTDERVEKGPVVCVQVYFEGKRTAEACDRKARQSDERWEVGVIERTNGMFEGAALAAMLASGDGGVEAGTAAGDAGAGDAPRDGGGAKADGGGGIKPPPKPPVVKPLPVKPKPPKPVEK